MYTALLLIPLLTGTQIIGRFNHITGDVKIKRAGAEVWGIVKEGFTVAEGDIIKTGETGRAEINFDSGEVIRMTENSQLEISQVLVTEARSFLRRVFLKSGKFYFEVKKKGSDVMLSVETPTAVVGVKGTEFGIKVNYHGKLETEVFCFEGKVWVRDIKEEKEVLLGKDMMTVVKYQSFPEEPQVMKKSQIAEWSGWISSGRVVEPTK